MTKHNNNGRNNNLDYNLVIVRHGESEWNKLHLFTGWRDVNLTTKGAQEARDAGQLLRADGFKFDVAYTSVLSRSILSLFLMLEEMKLLWIPIKKSWKLNERHYGRLQGKSKIEAAELHGTKQVHDWRRGFAIRPPRVRSDSLDHPKFDPRYASIDSKKLPSAESLKDVLERVVQYWDDEILPDLESGKKVLIVAHGNSLRALVKHLENISDAKICEVNLPTGIPKIYALNEEFKAASEHFHGDPDVIDERLAKAIGMIEYTK